MKIIKDIAVKLNNSTLLCAAFKSDNEEALCLYKGDRDFLANSEVLVRIHSGCITSEVFGMTNCDCKWQLDYSIKKVNANQAGIIIYLPGHEGCGNGLFHKIRSFELMNLGLSSKESYESLNLHPDIRDYKLAIDILHSFNVKRINLITNSPAKVMACIDGGIIVTKRVPAIIENPTPEIKKILEDQQKHFNHYKE